MDTKLDNIMMVLNQIAQQRISVQNASQDDARDEGEVL